MSLDLAHIGISVRVARQSLKSVLLFSVVILLVLLGERIYFQATSEQASSKLVAAQKVRDQIVLADEKLTMSAVAYALSGNRDWKQRYNATLPEIDSAIAQAKALVSPAQAAMFDRITGQANTILVELENTAFDLIEGGEATDAPAIFTSPRYTQNKAVLIRGTDQLLSMIDAEATAALANTRKQTLMLLIASLTMASIGFAFLWRRQNSALTKAESASADAEIEYRKQVEVNHAQVLQSSRMEQLGLLTATVAHELRNPLGAVRTSTFILEKKYSANDEKTKVILGRINSGVMRCDNIITQLLDFSRSSPASKTEQNLDEWLATTLQETSEDISPAVSITCDLGIGERKVAFDAGRLNRVMINLVSNAVEAMIGKGNIKGTTDVIDPSISIETKLTSRGAEIKIRDNGPGISEANLKKIFEPLFTTKNFGTGLGLPAVQKILEQHGGGLEVFSKEGHGAEFTAWLPA